jgi:Arc/MetJ-type ribon-helix-helix transcriptional regulator
MVSNQSHRNLSPAAAHDFLKMEFARLGVLWRNTIVRRSGIAKMTLTVRLPADLEKLVDEISLRRGMSKSDWVREALRLQAANETGPNPHAAYLEVIGTKKREGSGRGNLSRDAKRLVREKVRAKHHR